MHGSIDDAKTDDTNGRGRLVDIGGRRLAAMSVGSGNPPVILETGLGAESAEWAAVQNEVAAFARVLRYDRAGRGASDPALAPAPRTALGSAGSAPVAAGGLGTRRRVLRVSMSRT